MLGALLITGALGVIAGVAIAVFYKEIISWIGKAFEKLRMALNIAVVGSQIIMQKFEEGYKEISYHFSKLANNQWRKDTVVKKQLVNESEIPDEIIQAARQAAINQIIDITSQVEKQCLALQNSN